MRRPLTITAAILVAVSLAGCQTTIIESPNSSGPNGWNEQGATGATKAVDTAKPGDDGSAGDTE